MSTPERIVLIVCLIGGFLWLRGRARKLNLEKRQVQVVVGIFLVLPALLLAEKALFEKLPWSPVVNAPLMGVTLIATFSAVGFGFLRAPRPDEEDEAAAPEGEPKA